MAGNRAMDLQANVSAPPATVVDAQRGVVTSGTATLSFYLADAGLGMDSRLRSDAAAAAAHLVPRRCARHAHAVLLGLMPCTLLRPSLSCTLLTVGKQHPS